MDVSPFKKRKEKSWHCLLVLFVGLWWQQPCSSYWLESLSGTQFASVEYPMLVVETGHEKIALDGSKVVGIAAK